jgi:hypothetical protein
VLGGWSVFVCIVNNLVLIFQVTEDGTTEITSCGSRCASEVGANGSHQQVQQLVTTSELSKHEKASNWLISLPPNAGSTRSNQSSIVVNQSIADDGSGRDIIRFRNSGTKSSDRSKDSTQDTRNSSRSISYDDAKLVSLTVDSTF